MNKSKSVFISYSTDASRKAEEVSRHLKSLNLQSFIFEKDLKNNDGQHPARIRSEIEKCDAMILILSARSKESPWVSHELGIATGLNKTICVLKTSHNLKIPKYLDSYQVNVLKKTNDLYRALSH